LSPNDQNSDRGIETLYAPYSLAYQPQRPNDQNSDRGIETSSRKVFRRLALRPNDQNSDRGIETFTTQFLLVILLMSPNDQNSDRGIETSGWGDKVGARTWVRTTRIPTEELKLRDASVGVGDCGGGPNDQNSDRGIETGSVVVAVAPVIASERPEFRPRN